MSESANPMSMPRITKVSVNIGVGEGGERLVNAENVLELVTGVKPQRTLGRIQNRDLKVRQGAPIGCKATMRDSESIKKFLTDAFWVRENMIPACSMLGPMLTRKSLVLTKKLGVHEQVCVRGNVWRSRKAWHSEGDL